MNEQFLAAVLEQTGKQLKLHSLKIPAELKAGQVLVELAYSGVCHSQLMEVRGSRGIDKYLPHLLGHEGTGVVRKTGSRVSKVKVGDKVVLGWIKGSGLEESGTQYESETQKFNSGAVTTFNEFSVVSENRLTPLPAGVPMDVGVLFGCALLTGAGIVTNIVKPEKGSKVGIFGLGGIGLSALMATKLYDCRQVIAVDISEDKLALAKKLGADICLNPKKVSIESEILKLTNDSGLDYSIEASGLCSTIELAFSLVKKGGGLCVFASHPPEGQNIQLKPHDLISGKRIQGTWGGQCFPDIDIPKFGKLYVEGKLDLKVLMSEPYELNEINRALEDLEAHKVTRPIISINPKLGN